MTRRKPRHASFRTLERMVPDLGSREATVLLHVLQCEVCKEKMLAILEPPPLPAEARGEAYDEILARTTEKALEALREGRTPRRPE